MSLVSWNRYFPQKESEIPSFRWPRWDWRWTKTAVLAVWWSRRRRGIPKPSSFFSGKGDNPTSKQIVPCFHGSTRWVFKKQVYKMRIIYISSCLVWGNIITCECKLPPKSSCERHRSVIIDKTSRIYMGVSKNRGTTKWMMKIMEKPVF